MNSPTTSSSIGGNEEERRKADGARDVDSLAVDAGAASIQPVNSLNVSKRTDGRLKKTRSRRRAANANASASAYAPDVTNHNWRPSSLG